MEKKKSFSQRVVEGIAHVLEGTNKEDGFTVLHTSWEENDGLGLVVAINCEDEVQFIEIAIGKELVERPLDQRQHEAACWLRQHAEVPANAVAFESVTAEPIGTVTDAPFACTCNWAESEAWSYDLTPLVEGR